MTTTSFDTTTWLPKAPPVPRPRVRGLRLPSWPLLAQVGGSGAALAGVYLAFGVAVFLIVGGVSAVLVGALRESGRI